MQSSHVLEDVTDTRLGEGHRYNPWNDAVSETLPPKQARGTAHRIGLEEIGMAFQEGIDSGPGRAADEVFDSLEEKYSGLING